MRIHCRPKAPRRGHPRCPGRGHARTLLALIPIAVVILCGCTSSSGGSSQYREVCEGVPDCQAVSSLPVDAAGIRPVFISCPADRPYVWDWGYQASANVQAWLESTVNDPDAASGPGATIVVDTKGLPGVFTGTLACSRTPVETPGVEVRFSGVEREPPPWGNPGPAPADVWGYGIAAPPGQVSAGGRVTGFIDSVLRANPTHRQYEGKTWMLFERNSVSVLPTPGAWGRPVTDPLLSQGIPFSTGAGYDPVLGSKYCSSDNDCSAGRCLPMLATVTQPGSHPGMRCTGPADAIPEEVYKLVSGAQDWVDVTTLCPGPDGRFLGALRNAVTYLAHTGRTVTIRILIGTYPFEALGVCISPACCKVDAAGLLRTITSEARSVPGARLELYAGQYYAKLWTTPLTNSWNHSKIVAVDSRTAVVGGENLWTNDYLTRNPVNDLNIRVDGGAVYGAHRYASRLWAYTCHWNDDWYYKNWIHSKSWKSSQPGEIGTECLVNISGLSPPATGTATVMGVGRLGWIDMNGNQADAALVAMIQSAASTIRISQQDLLGVWPDQYPVAILEALAGKIAAGKDVYVVVSNANAKPGTPSWLALPYSTAGYSPADVARTIAGRVPAQPDKSALLCSKLHVASVGQAGAHAWADSMALANHAKTMMVDDEAFYVGSHNMYPVQLQEFGFIVEDPGAARRYLEDYWNPLWEASKSNAVSGHDAPTCIFR